MNKKIFKKVFIITLIFLVFLSGVIADKIFLSKFNIQTPFKQSNLNKAKNLKELILNEKEPDNSFNQASEIKSGYQTKGSLNTSRDVDFYYFTVEKPSDVRFEFKNVPIEYQVFIYDANKNLIASSNRSGFIASVSLIKITKPGKYFLKVLSSVNSNSVIPYTLTMTILPIIQ